MGALETLLPNNDAPQASYGNSSAFGRTIVTYILVLSGYLCFYLIFFSPALLHNLILAPGDGINTFYPALARHWSLWTDQMYSGYPIFSEPQYFTWSPLRIFGSHYDAAVITAYVIASFTAFSYVKLVTKSLPGGLVAGFVYGAGGFMMSHLGHFSIIHSAAWIPAIFLGGELLARNGRWRSGTLISAGTALSFLGGHPQPWVYGVIVFAIYMTWRGFSRNEDDVVSGWRLTIYAGLYAVVGVAIVAVQLWPLHELAEHTVRNRWTFDDFISYAMPPKFLIHGLFPNLFGNVSGYYHYFFEVWPAEIGFYTGVIPLVLAVLAVIVTRPKGITSFWAVTAIFALIYALGGSTPLGHIAFHIPVVDTFRAPGRSVMIFDLAIGTLAGMGIASLEKNLARPRRMELIGLAGCTVGFAAAAAWVVIMYPKLSGAAAARSVHLPSITHNPAVLLPCVFFLIALAGSAWCCLFARKKLVVWALVLFTVLDVSSYGWFTEWRTKSIPAKEAQVAAQWQPIIKSSQLDYGRVMDLDGAYAPVSPAQPALNLASGLASAGGHDPLVLDRYASLSGIHEMGAFWGDVPRPSSPLWQLLGVKWIFQTNTPVSAVLGSGCGDAFPRQDLTLAPPTNTAIAAIQIVSTMHCSKNVQQGAPVLQVGVEGTGRLAVLRAGIDTGEWAADRPDVRGLFKNSVAHVYKSIDTGQGYQLRWYETTVKVGAPEKGDKLLFHALIPPGSNIELRQVSVTDVDGRVINLPIINGVYSTDTGWTALTPPPGTTFAARNANYLGRAWLVHDGIELGDAATLSAIHTGVLPDGRRFMPSQMALSDHPISGLDATRPTDYGHVSATRLSGDAWDLNIRSDRPALVVMSQVDYPGWHATLNGVSAPILRVDYALQGVRVPAGDSVIRLRFRPLSVLVGGILSILGILFVFLLCLSPLRSRFLPGPRVA